MKHAFNPNTERKRWKRMQNAMQTLERIGIDPRSDFHALRSSQVDQLLEEADKQRYRKPRNANGSRARYFHARLCRMARHGKFFELFALGQIFPL